jgi:regulator of ribonuclease activity A
MSDRLQTTADLCDRYLDKIRVVDLQLSNFGGQATLLGSAFLIEIEEDNRILFKLLDQDGYEKVVVIKVISGARPAVVGERVVELAVRRGWGGIIVDGAVRFA